MLYFVQQYKALVSSLFVTQLDTVKGGGDLQEEKKDIQVSPDVKETTEGKDLVENTKNELSELKDRMMIESVMTSLKGLKGEGLSEGDKGSKFLLVERLQIMLHQLGYGDIVGTIDGDYGPKLTKAVMDLQGDLGIDVGEHKGAFYEATFNALEKVMISKFQSIEVTEETNEDEKVHDKKNTSKGIGENGKTLEFTTSSLDIKFGSGNEDFVGLRENINNASYEVMITSMDFNELSDFYIKTKKLSDTHNIRTVKNKEGKEVSEYYFTPFNISELEQAFEDKNYVADGGFGGIEMGSLMTLVENVYRSQDALNKATSFKDKLAVVLDYNQDGLLDDKVHFYTKELQLFEAIKREEQFSNFLNNLGYSSTEDFWSNFTSNYFATRINFKNSLGTVLSVKDVLNPGEMLVNPNAMREFNEAKVVAEKEVDNVLENHEATKDLPQETKRGLKLQAVGLIAGSSVGAGAAFDIKEVTKNIIDSLQIGIINGVPGIGIAKNIYRSDEGGFRIDAAAVNLIPMLSASGVVKKAEYEEFKKLFPKEIDSSMEVTLIGGISTLGETILVDFSSIDEDSRKGIEDAKEDMSELLDETFECIEAGKTFEDTKFKAEPSNKAIYDALTGLYKSNGENNEIVKYLKEGALNNYERELYANAEGFNFRGVSIGLLFLSGYLPIPLVLAHGENHSIEWKEVKTYTAGAKEGTIDSGIGSIENLEFLRVELSQVGEQITSNTRYNGGETVLDPNKTLEQRWEGLKAMSELGNNFKHKTENPSYTGIGKLGNSPLRSVLSGNDGADDINKLYIISTLSQYMKKASNFEEGNTDKWTKEKVSDFIKTDTERRAKFDSAFGFSLQDEAEMYYKKIQKTNGKFGSQEKFGLGFDSISTIIDSESRKSVAGIDTLYTNLSILTVDGEPLLIPITDQKKIDAFKNTINGLTHLSDEIKTQLITGLDSGNVELNYYKDPEGFDDRIIPIVKNTKLLNGGVPQIDVFQPSFKTVAVGLGIVGEKKEDVTTVEDGSVYTSPDGEVTIVTDNDGNIINTSGVDIPAGTTNISELALSDEFGNPIILNQEALTTQVSNAGKINEVLQKEGLPNND